MANTFLSVTQVVGTTPQVAYSAPSDVQSVIIIGMRLSNDTGADIAVNCSLIRTGVRTKFLGEDTPVPAGSALEGVMGSKLVLQALDQLEFSCGVANGAQLLLSVMEVR